MIFTVNVLDQDVDVEVTHYQPFTPGIRTGHPDNWTDDEGQELEWVFTENNLDFVVVAIENNDDWMLIIDEQVFESMNENITH